MKCTHKRKKRGINRPEFIRPQALRVERQAERIAFENDLIKQAGMDTGYISAEDFDRLEME